MKKFLLVALLVVGLAAISTPASAFDLGGYVGGIKFNFGGVTNSGDQTYKPEDFGIDPNLIFPVDLISNGPTGETWGIFRLENIEKDDPLDPQILWSPTGNNENIYGIVYGLYDVNQEIVPTAGGSDFNVYQTGGHFKLWLEPSEPRSGYDPTNGVTGRIGQDGYKSISDIGNQLFLTGDFVSGITSDPNVTVLQSLDFNGGVLGEGKGDGLAEITGGAYAYFFGPNLDFSFTVTPLAANPQGWDFAIDDPVRGTVVPEPASMLLLGSGLIGLAGLRKKKRA